MWAVSEYLLETTMYFLSNTGFYYLYTVRTTRPEKCDIFAQRYQSQPVSTNSKNSANIS